MIFKKYQSINDKSSTCKYCILENFPNINTFSDLQNALTQYRVENYARFSKKQY